MFPNFPKSAPRARVPSGGDLHSVIKAPTNLFLYGSMEKTQAT